MKELAHEEWIKNPTPREMWVWDEDATHKIKAEVVYCCDAVKVKYPVIAISEGITEGSQCVQVYKHCAEIEEPKTRRMTKQELSWWLRDGKHREWSYERAHAYSCFDYYVNDADVPVEDTIFIREDGGEWKEPLVEV